MALQCFHLFPYLPTELRQEIWAFAVRDEHPDSPPRIHYLTITKREPRRPLSAEALSPATSTAVIPDEDGNTNKLQRPIPYMIIPPWNHPLNPPPEPNYSNILSQYSWAQGPKSIYAPDTGLWTACTESRAVIARLTTPWSHAMASFTTRDNETNYLTVRPFSDLFCFDPARLDPLVTWAVLFANLPFYKLRRSPGSTATLVRDRARNCEIDNLAFEFDPTWVDRLSPFWPSPHWSIKLEGTVRGFVTRTVHHLADAGPPCTVYLIDRSLADDYLVDWPATLRGLDRERAYFEDAQDAYVEIQPRDIVHIPGVAAPPQPDVFTFRDYIVGMGYQFPAKLPRWKFSVNRDLRVLCCLPPASKRRMQRPAASPLPTPDVCYPGV